MTERNVGQRGEPVEETDQATAAGGQSAARRGTESSDEVWRDPDRLPLDELSSAMAVYSADGQVDDVTGGDAGAEAEFGHGPQPRTEEQDRPSPEGRSGPL